MSLIFVDAFVYAIYDKWGTVFIDIMTPENAIVGLHVGNQLEEDFSQQSSLPSDKLEEGTQRETMFGGEAITVSV